MESFLQSLLTPAIFVGISAYLVNFFGKAIADQQPFTDDRNWFIQLHGSHFILGNALSFVVGIVLANHFPISLNGFPLIILIAFFIYTIITLTYLNKSLSSQHFDYKKQEFEEEDKKNLGVPSQFARWGDITPPILTRIMMFYFGALVYKSGNLVWLTVIAILIFHITLMFAFRYSLKELERVELMTIIFKDGNIEPMTDVQILKINDDNLRVRKDNVITLINKTEVLKIEMKIPDKSL